MNKFNIQQMVKLRKPYFNYKIGTPCLILDIVTRNGYSDYFVTFGNEINVYLLEDYMEAKEYE